MAANVLFKSGAKASFDAIVNKDNRTFYRVENTDGTYDLYLGSERLSNQDELKAAIDRVAENEADIKTLQDELSALAGTGSGSIGDQINAVKVELENKIAENKAEIQANDKEIADNKTSIAANVKSIETLTANLATTSENLQTEIDAVEDDIAKNVKPALTTVEGKVGTLEGKVSTLETDSTAEKEKVSTLEGKMTTAEGNIATLQGNMTQAQKDIDAIEADYLKAADKTELSGLISAEAERADAAEKVNAGKIAAIEADYLKKADKTELQNNINTVSSDLDKIESTVNAFFDENAVTDGAVDTLKEIQAMLDAKGDAATLAGQIQEVKDSVTANKALIDANKAAIESNDEDIAANLASINAINDASSGILAQAKADAKAKADAVQENVDNLTTVVNSKAAQADLDALEGEVALKATEADLTSAENKISALETLTSGYGTIVSKNVDDYDIAGTAATKANEALVSAQSYTDNALTWAAM